MEGWKTRSPASWIRWPHYRATAGASGTKKFEDGHRHRRGHTWQPPSPKTHQLLLQKRQRGHALWSPAEARQCQNRDLESDEDMLGTETEDEMWTTDAEDAAMRGAASSHALGTGAGTSNRDHRGVDHSDLGSSYKTGDTAGHTKVGWRSSSEPLCFHLLKGPLPKRAPNQHKPG